MENPLGSGLISFAPYSDGGGFDEGEESICCFVVSCCDTPEGFLDPADERLDLVTLAVEGAIEGGRDFAVGLERDHGLGALLPDQITDVMRVVSLVGQYHLAGLHISQQARGDRAGRSRHGHPVRRT